MERRYQKMLLTSLLVVYALIMIIGAIIPNPQAVPVYSGNTAYFHFFGFLVLSVLIFRTVNLYNIKYRTFWSFFLLVLFIMLTEVLQLLVSTRNASFADMLIDIAGCLVGWGLYLWMYSKR
ncbi:MAG: VanZ family protein [Candidatus Woesearchaeota archaeon]